jgi:SAM (Sterile alpha motif) domain-containing protein
MQQIADWLEKLGLSEYAQRFAENDIDFTILPKLVLFESVFVDTAFSSDEPRAEAEGECEAAKHAPGAGPGKRVTDAGTHTASRKATEGIRQVARQRKKERFRFSGRWPIRLGGPIHGAGRDAVAKLEGVLGARKVLFAALLKICAGMTHLCAPTDKWSLRMSWASKKFPPLKNLGYRRQTGTPLD